MKKLLFVLVIFTAVYVHAQAAAGLKVVRVPNCSETPSNYYVVNYPNGVTYAKLSGGFLSIKDSTGIEIALWSPGQWVRVEK